MKTRVSLDVSVRPVRSETVFDVDARRRGRAQHFIDCLYIVHHPVPPFAGEKQWALLIQ